MKKRPAHLPKSEEPVEMGSRFSKKQLKEPIQFPHPDMTPEQHARCRPAYEVDELAAPIPTHTVSNGEYFVPFLQTEDQKKVEARVKELAEKGSKKLGISRRRFLQTSVGMAASFIALNEVFRKSAFGETLFAVGKEGMFDEAAFLADGPPSDLFVFDDQTHIVRGLGHAWGNIGTLLRHLAQGETARFPNSPYVSNFFNSSNFPDERGEVWGNWNPRLINRTNYDDTEYWLHNWIKYMYFESQTTVALISAVPAGQAAGQEGVVGFGTRNADEARATEIITAQQVAASRDFVNRISGSTRAIAQGLCYIGAGNVPYLQEQIDRFNPDSWKGYQTPTAKRDSDPNTFFESWRFDDKELCFPTWEFIRNDYRKVGKLRPGRNCISVHKGLGETSNPSDIEVSAAAFPELNFNIYHSCIRPSFFLGASLQDLNSSRLRDGVPDILDVAEFAQRVAPYPNVNAELGTTWAACCVTFPTVAIHIIGILLKYLGPDRVIWGTDSTWYGSPQWQIEAFWRFQIPEAIRKLYCYPEVTPAIKRKILGLNSARQYRLSPDLRNYNVIPHDYYDRMLADTKLMSIMEYDDFLLNEVPVEGGPPIPQVSAPSPYGVATAKRNDRMDLLRAHYKERFGTKQGIPRDNVRLGFIRVV